MHFLNLMPDYQKQSVKRERSFLIAHNAIGIVLIIVTISSSILVASRYVLKKNYERLQIETTLVNTGEIGLQKDIISLNEKIENAEAVRSEEHTSELQSQSNL